MTRLTCSTKDTAISDICMSVLHMTLNIHMLIAGISVKTQDGFGHITFHIGPAENNIAL